MNYWADIWHWLTTSRYTRNLELAVELLRAEQDRLRAENRALLNSLLGTAGHAPIDSPTVAKEVPIARRRSWPQMQAHLTRKAADHLKQQQTKSAEAQQ